jgi:hypothetical protein
MSEFTKHPEGAFCWLDLATTDQPASKKFYIDLFRWSADDQPMGPDSFYSMMQKGGKNVGAIFTQRAEDRTSGIPPHWNMYIAVDDVDAAAKKAESLGAKLLAPPMDVFEAGRMAVISDPSGGVVGLWQAKQHIGVQLRNETNALGWCELWTRDLDAAEKFYSAMFGWSASKMGEDDYRIFSRAGASEAGMMKIAAEWGEMPPTWTPYLQVNDCAGAHARAARLGAATFVPPSPIPDIGHFAIVKDPQGAVFGILDTKKP